MSMPYKEAIDYLRPVADNHPRSRYAAALEAAIRAMEEVEQLNAEKTQLLEDLRQSGRHEPCDYCKHNEAWLAYCTRGSLCDECLDCACPCNNCEEFSKWEWRGIPNRVESDTVNVVEIDHVEEDT